MSETKVAVIKPIPARITIDIGSTYQGMLVSPAGTYQNQAVPTRMKRDFTIAEATELVSQIQLAIREATAPPALPNIQWTDLLKKA